MARITNITFWHESKDAGVFCDKCRAYITNVYTVYYNDGLIAHYGIECFKKLKEAGNLSDFGYKLLMKTLHKIKKYNEELQLWQTITEEEAEKKELLDSLHHDDVWKGRTFEEYRQFHVKRWLPARLKDCEKTILRFKNIDFKF